MPLEKVEIKPNPEKKLLATFDLAALEVEIGKVTTIAQMKPVVVKLARFQKATTTEDARGRTTSLASVEAIPLPR